MIRYVVRYKSVRRSPALLAEALGVQTRRYPGRLMKAPSYNRDLLFVYPRPEELLETGSTTREIVHQLHGFFNCNKYSQRRYLQATGIPIPWTAGNLSETSTAPSNTSFVVRPLRHSQSQNFRVTTSVQDFSPGQEYISSLFPKTREYRILYVLGKPLIILRKKPNEGVGPEEAWGHVNSHFQTIQDVPNCKLSGTDIFSRLGQCPIVQNAHILGVDVLWNRHGYVVLEFNSSPALTIENNISKVAEFIKQQRA